MKCNLTFGHVTPLAPALASSIAPLHSVGHDNQKNMEHGFSGHVSPLMTQAIQFLRSR